jgi:hypothetical protein
MIIAHMFNLDTSQEAILAICIPAHDLVPKIVPERVLAGKQ